jgi:outer membrane protein OmpA-like peptidoglycan-associated protein
MFSKDSRGELDLYVSTKQSNGGWGVPINLGKKINTNGSEISPFLAEDGKTLFFASNGHQGLGGFDIFMSKRLDNGWLNWSEPINLGPEINTNGFDAYFSLGKGKTAFFVSKREGNEFSKIYTTQFTGKLLEAEPTKTTKISEATAKIDAITPKDEKKSDCEEPCKQIESLKNEWGTRLSNIEKKNEDFFKEVSAEKAVAVPKPIYVFFKINSSVIDEEFKNELLEAASFLKSNPSFSILLTGHTDKKGNQDYNKKLAEKRAKACQDFLIKEGISSNKIVLNSFGSDRNISDKIFTNEAQNRRVELHFKKD